eukprot:TRINITY_DN21040_c0_g1_i2.p1 TRINITY_DN21040_c0_g1~~TRINITY_DN21040_c0_g1_i2.p1  ORF type:complete len:199 (-),score=34.67 TRINITY_DN21040_c0_g1_i2:152-748(-)
MSRRRSLEVQFEDRTPQKWLVSLREDVLAGFISQGGTTVHSVFGEGMLFSPLLFGKFFDPSDAFPLWDFESEILLSGLRSSGRCSVDWFATDKEYVLKAELPDSRKNDVQIYVENGKVMEISGLWRQQESNANDWKSRCWWEFGYVRRIELPENSNWRKMETNVIDDCSLEIRIPKNNSDSDVPQAYDESSSKESAIV